MKISPISFGKKIPLTKCHIKDNLFNKFIPATFYEVDCKDSEEIEEIENSLKNWIFGRAISRNIHKVHSKSDSQLKFNNETFYEMRTNDDEIVGICQVNKLFPNLKIELFETRNDKRYKYVGQTMMASLGKIAKHEKLKKLYIPIPVADAVDFYVDKCGFKHCRDGGIGLYMKTSRAKTIQRRAEANINSPIIDLMV